MTGRERDQLEHAEALKRFGGRMPKGQTPWPLKPSAPVLCGAGSTTRFRESDDGQTFETIRPYLKRFWK